VLRQNWGIGVVVVVVVVGEREKREEVFNSEIVMHKEMVLHAFA
jgi:hypothetical protein